MKRNCPYCKSKIPADATVCRYCHRDVQPLPPKHCSLTKGLLLTMAFISGFALVGFMYGYYRERLMWDD